VDLTGAADAVHTWPHEPARPWLWAPQARIAKLTGMTVVELRQYTLAAGRRDELIDLFEAEFMEPQEACGIRILGTFRDLGDAQRFVWIRSFPDMVARAKSLADFYGGSAWRRHR